MVKVKLQYNVCPTITVRKHLAASWGEENIKETQTFLQPTPSCTLVISPFSSPPQKQLKGIIVLSLLKQLSLHPKITVTFAGNLIPTLTKKLNEVPMYQHPAFGKLVQTVNCENSGKNQLQRQISHMQIRHSLPFCHTFLDDFIKAMTLCHSKNVWFWHKKCGYCRVWNHSKWNVHSVHVCRSKKKNPVHLNKYKRSPIGVSYPSEGQVRGKHHAN